MLLKFYLFIFLFGLSINAYSQRFEIDTSLSIKTLIKKYLLAENQDAIKVANIRYKGLNWSVGLYNYNSNYNMLPDSGLILSTGSAIAAKGPNNITSSIENYTGMDDDLSNINNSKTFDSAIIEFDFISLTDSINFIFQFGSEEYPEYVKKGVSDIFGFFIGDSTHTTNIATIKEKGVPITIDLINNKINANYYIPNNYSESKQFENTDFYTIFQENKNLFQFDGFTKPISTGLKVEPFKKYHFKIAIADVGDRKYDSWIFIEAHSFMSTGNIVSPNLENLKEYFHFNEINDIEINKIKDGYNIVIPIYFKFNSYNINKDQLIYLDYLVEILKYSNFNLIINGYADKMGSENYNLQLSKLRANKIREHLIRMGINQKRISSIGHGELNSDIDSMSRKVEFIFNY